MLLYGFQQGKSTTEPIFALRMMQEKHLEKRQNLHMTFVEKKRMTESKEILYVGTKKETGLHLIQDMYDGCTTSVRTLIGSTESFEVNVVYTKVRR